MPPITLHHLQASRSIRIAWLLEELSLPYTIISADRERSGLSPATFKESTGTILGKAPVLKDGDLILEESGAITEYLLASYDEEHRLMARGPSAAWAKTLHFIHAAEGTMMTHCLPFIYVNRIDAAAAEGLRPKLARIVGKDLDWLEQELGLKGGGWLVGESVSAADTMMAFSVMFIFANGLAPKDGRWRNVERWLQRVEERKAWREAVRKTGFELPAQ